jgi:serine/threonine protein kinase
MFSNKQYVKFGGNLLFDEFALPDTDILNINGLIKSKNDPETGKLTYQMINNGGNKFTHNQLKSVRLLINFVLPNMTFKGQSLGKEFITNVETIGAGNFGITIYYNNLIIKVLHTSPTAYLEDIIREVKTLENIFFDKGKTPPFTLNKYYGFMAGKKMQGMFGPGHGTNFFKQPSEQINLCSNLFGSAVDPNAPFNTGRHFSIDAENIIKNIKESTNKMVSALNYMKNNFLDEIVLIFLDKEDGDLENYIANIVPTLDNTTKLAMAKKLLVDIDIGLQFLHKQMNLMHFDIKPQNIVYKMGPDGVPVFKIIDFGSTASIDPTTGIAKVINPYTVNYMDDTRHKNTKSYMYDNWCLLLSALKMLGDLKNDGLKMLSAQAEEIYNIHGSGLDKAGLHAGLQVIYKIMTERYNYNLPPLNLRENYRKMMLIYNLLATSNIPNGVPPLKYKN